LYPFQILDWARVSDGRDLFWVGFDATLRDDKAEKHPPWNPKDEFLGVELDILVLQAFECLIEIGN
jgi:hypothetical protein